MTHQYLEARPSGQAASEFHQGAADLVLHGGLAVVVMHRLLSAAKEAASAGSGGGRSGGGVIMAGVASEGHFGRWWTR